MNVGGDGLDIVNTETHTYLHMNITAKYDGLALCSTCDKEFFRLRCMCRLRSMSMRPRGDVIQWYNSKHKTSKLPSVQFSSLETDSLHSPQGITFVSHFESADASECSPRAEESWVTAAEASNLAFAARPAAAAAAEVAAARPWCGVRFPDRSDMMEASGPLAGQSMLCLATEITVRMNTIRSLLSYEYDKVVAVSQGWREMEESFERGVNEQHRSIRAGGCGAKIARVGSTRKKAARSLRKSVRMNTRRRGSLNHAARISPISSYQWILYYLGFGRHLALDFMDARVLV